MPPRSEPPRPKQDTPQEVVNDILGVIRRQFYADASDKQFYQDRNFLLRNVVLYPAAWLNAKAVTLPTSRYKQIILDVLQEIKRHGQTGTVKYWPGYLRHCLQQHFRHNGEAIYNEAKNARTLAEQALAIGRRAVGSGPDPVEQLAQAREIIQIKRRTAKKAPSNPLADPQQTLF